MSASFSTHILDQVLQRRAREWEVLRTRTLSRLRDGLSRLPVAFETVVIFGSLIHPGHFGPHSDIDVAFFGLADQDYFVAKRFLEAEMELELDVIQLETHRLRETIVRKGISWNRNDLSCSAPT